jgi:membrane-anchored glycerophosphoryl diester phosphodiesterase (GDPDase)
MVKQHMKSIKKFFADLFNDNNTINEKAVVGFIAFIMMVITLITDLVTGVMGKNMPIHQFIFDGFMIIVLGAFGIASIDKWINKTKVNKEEDVQ